MQTPSSYFQHPPFPTKYWSKLPNGKIRCEVCPRLCELHEGQAGMCFVRECKGEQIVLSSYGKTSGLCIDPIEKKPLNHFFPGSSVLSFGTAGCNLACKYCQNWDISKSRSVSTISTSASPEQIAELALRHSCTSVAFTYNDPVIFLEYAHDTALECHKRNIRTVAVTAGYILPEPRRDLFSVIDATNVDLKSIDNSFYKNLCAAEIKPVLDTLLYLRNHTKVWLEVTTLVIPGFNDSEGQIRDLVNWIADNLGPSVPLHFSAFHPDYKMLNVTPTPRSTLIQAREIGLSQGLRYVYTGNISDIEGSSTYCHQCGTQIITRDGYAISSYLLDESGNCSVCHEPCAGIFDQIPGSWGSHRLPVFA